MNILIAPDKFKGTLDAGQVSEAVKAGLLTKGEVHNITTIPMADGGEGTCNVLTALSGGKMMHIKVLDPLFREVEAAYGISNDGKSAFIEVAAASGLSLLTLQERNPLETTTYGTGQIILDAIAHGVQEIILGIGGTATNDAGIGMAEALGFRFISANGNVLKPIGENLQHINSISVAQVNSALRKISVTALCDVNNTLFGQNGAAYVFASQKGADENAIKILDEGLRNFYEVIKKQFTIDLNFEGAGAGGGISAGAKIFLNASLKSGIEFLMHYTGFEELVAQADVIITGEGKIDKQTLSGKVIKGISTLALKHHKPLFAVAGKNELNQEDLGALGIRKVISLIDSRTSMEEAMKNTFAVIRRKVAEELVPMIARQRFTN